MSLEQTQRGTIYHLIKRQIVNPSDTSIKIQKEKIEKTESFVYLGCCIATDQKMEEEIKIRLSTAFNMLKYCV